MFAEARQACDGRAKVVEGNTRAMIKAGKIGAIEALLPGNVGGALFGTTSRQQTKAKEAYGMLRNWVFSATDAISTRCAGQPWMAGHYEAKPTEAESKRRPRKDIREWYIRNKSQDQPGDIKPDPNHSILWLLDKPNRIQGRYEFIYITVMNLLLTGEWYWIGGVNAKKNKAEVWAVPSAWIVPDHSSGLFGGYKLVTGYGEGVPLAPENVARGYFPDPSDIRNCLAPLSTCSKAARIDDYILNSQEASFERGINPNLIITIGKSIGVDGKPVDRRPTLRGAQRRQIVRAVRHIWTQTVNQGDPAILDGLIENIHKLQNTPQEMDWQNSGEVVKARIFQAFKVNPIIVGEVTPANKAQAVVAETNICNAVVNPILGNISSAASEFFGNFYEDGETLAVYLEKAVPHDEEREDKQWADARRNKDVTQDETRARMKLEPLKKAPPRSPLLENPTALAAITNVAAQVTAGAISHDNAVKILMVGLQISEADADEMVPEDPPKPSPEELAAAAAANAPAGAPQGPPTGPPTNGKPKPKKPPKKPPIDEEALAKRLAAMLTLKWSEEEHPRDEGGRFAETPGESGPGLGDANKPGDNPKASLKERAKYAIARSEKLVAEAVKNGEEVGVVESWDDVDEDTKNDTQNSYVDDHLSEFEEPYYEEWTNEVLKDAEKEVEKDEDFSRDTWIDWATDRGYSKESAEAAIDNDPADSTGSWLLGDMYVDPSQLKWESGNILDSPGQQLMEHGEAATHAITAEQDFAQNDRVKEFDAHYLSAAEEEARDRAKAIIEDGPQESFDGAYQDAANAFDALDDSEKLEMAGIEQKITAEMPDEFEPISDGEDYEKTGAIVRVLQDKIMQEELTARGIHNADQVDTKAVAKKLWEGWKGSSTGGKGLLIQYATALELGGLSQEFTPEQRQSYMTAAARLSKEYGGYSTEPFYSDDDPVIDPTAATKNVERGIEIAKAHIHATWAATQYALSKAGMDHVDMYRGLQLSKSKFGLDELPSEHVSVTAADGGERVYTKLPTLSLKRYGAASTTTKLSVANQWGGVGEVPKDAERVVMRIKAPRESLVSIPAFGQNVTEEQELILAGQKDWDAWDAWYLNAPPASKVAIKQLVIKSRRRIMVVSFDESQINRVPAGEPGGGQFTSGSGGGGGESFVSPNKDENTLTLSEAEQRLRSERQVKLKEKFNEIDKLLDAHTSGAVGAVGAWADGAENSTITVYDGDDYDTIRAAGAMKGLLAEQKAVLTFKYDEEGEHAMLSATFKGSMETVHESLSNGGIAFHTLVPKGDSVEVHVFGDSPEVRDAFNTYAESNNGTGKQARPGHGDFIGSWDSREEGRAAYEKEIDGYLARPGMGDRQAEWRRLRDHWSETALKFVRELLRLKQHRTD